MLLIEIAALIFLCKKNGLLAIQKGLKPGLWKMYTILAWLFAELIGIGIGISMFGKQDLLKLSCVGIFTAFGGYLLIKFILENKPDATYNDDDVKKVSVDDLRPPKVN